MAETPQTFFLTTPIYYVNARPHIGHAYTTIVGDVLARRSRAQGIDTYFLTGTDEHGQKIERSAAAAGIVPQQFADQVSKTFSDLWQRMGITHDKFIRTTDEAHKRGVQKLFTTLQANGAIYKDTYTGQYCVSDEAFVDVAPGAPCPDCGRPTETISETNYYFKLSEYQQRLLDLIESNTLLIQPDSRRNEVLSFLRGPVNTLGAPRLDSETWVGPPQPSHALTAAGTPYIPGALKDLSISRTSFQWGIPVPGDEEHVIYVWLDALANYMTALGYGTDDESAESLWQKYWPADLHIVGKEIIRFHCVYWPAFLMAAGLPLPKQVVAHGWLLFEESKMSKSKGNIVRTETILDAFGTLCPPPPASADVDRKGAPSGVPQTPPVENMLGPSGPNTAAATDTNPAHLSAEATIKGTTSVVPPDSPAQAPASAAETILPAESERALLKHHQDLFAADILRYFLLREIPFGQDGSFSFDALITRYNADLANGYGNLVSRTLTMIKKYLGGEVCRSGDQVRRFVFMVGEHLLIDVAQQEKAFDALNLTSTLRTITGYITSLDQSLSEKAPWKLVLKQDAESRSEVEEILYQTAESIRIITALLYPILPYATASVWRQLGLGDIERAASNGDLKNLQWGGLQPGTKLGPLSPIFPRADKGLAQIMSDLENPAPIACVTGPNDPPSAKLSAITAQHDATHPATDDLPTTPIASEQSVSIGVSSVLSLSTPTDSEPQITIDDFAKVELRVAQIVVAERIPKADKLLRLEVDLGYEKRQILSGIAEWYTPEELIGRRIVVITNLAPRKMRGLESHGMLLAASTEGGKPYLCTFADAESLPLGSRIK